jgi:hypothetical protein
MKRNELNIGLILIIIGTIAILDNFFHIEFFSMEKLWPLAILLPGLLLEYSYAKTRKLPGLLIPGGILTSLGIFFLFNTYTNWDFAEYTWPVYPLTVAIGLYQYYKFGGKPKPLLVPILIITTFCLVSFANIFFEWLNRRVLAAIVLVLVGLYLVMRAAFTKKDNN